MVVFGTSKSSPSILGAKERLFERPLEKLLDLNAIKQLNEIIAQQQERQIDRLLSSSRKQHETHETGAASGSSREGLCRLQVCSSLSMPLTSSLSTWAKLSKENNPTKRKRAAARLRRYTIDANNNNSNSSQSDNSSANQSLELPEQLSISVCRHRLHALDQQFDPTNEPVEFVDQREKCQKLLLTCLPEPIRFLMRQLYLKGPSTVGIFRKSPNAKHCRELRQKLEQLFVEERTRRDTIERQRQHSINKREEHKTTSSTNKRGQSSPRAEEEEEEAEAEEAGEFETQETGCNSVKKAIEQFQVNVIASVFKEWLRSLPDCLLMSRLYEQWIDVAKLIEPLHALKQQQQQQQQQQSQQQRELEQRTSLEQHHSAGAPPTREASVSDCSRDTFDHGDQEPETMGPLRGPEAARRNIEQAPTSERRRPTVAAQLTPSLLTDNSAERPLARALSCALHIASPAASSFSSAASSDSGHSSSSPDCSLDKRHKSAPSGSGQAASSGMSSSLDDEDEEQENENESGRVGGQQQQRCQYDAAADHAGATTPTAATATSATESRYQVGNEPATLKRRRWLLSSAEDVSSDCARRTSAARQTTTTTLAHQVAPVQFDTHQNHQFHQLDNDNYNDNYKLAPPTHHLNSAMQKDDLLTSNRLINKQMSTLELSERRLECVRIIRQLLENMNEANSILLKALICVLWHIAAASEHNKMSSNNLGVCVGQSLLNDEKASNCDAKLAAKQTKRLARNNNSNCKRAEGQMMRAPLYASSSSTNLCSAGLGGSSLSFASSRDCSQQILPKPNKFTKRHRRARSQCLLASTLSLANLTSSGGGGGASSFSGNHFSSPQQQQQHQTKDNQRAHFGSTSALLMERNGQQESAKYVPILLAFMIDEARELFGADVIDLFGVTNKRREQPVCARPRASTRTTSASASASTTITTNHQNAPKEDADSLISEHQHQQQVQHMQQLGRLLNRRHLSTSVLVHVGGENEHHHKTAPQHLAAHCAPKSTPNQERDQHHQDATTSILIVQAPSPRRAGRAPSETAINAPQQQQQQQPQRQLQLQLQNQQQQQQVAASAQQRPLSVTGSTVSSSSTSGVHSDSPVFSLSSSASSGSEHERPDRNRSSSPSTTSCGPSSHGCSSAGSICSPSPSSGCTSPVCGHHIEVTREQLVRQRCSSEQSPLKVIEEVRQATSEPLEQPKPPLKINGTTNDSSIIGARNNCHPQPRPRSMLGLDEIDGCLAGEVGGETAGDIGGGNGDAQRRLAPLSCGAPPANVLGEQQQQQQAALSAAGTQMVVASRMPKIPFQLTTSSYGGEAVLYYPSRAHLAQTRRQQQQQKQQQQQMQLLETTRDCHQTLAAQRQQQQVAPRQLARQHLPAALNALEQQQQQQQQQQQLQQQQQQQRQPSRSHVMMLRDYYLSLQRQNQEQQKQHTRMQQQALQLVRSQHESQRLSLNSFQFDKQQQCASASSSGSLSLANLSESSGRANQQLVQPTLQTAAIRTRLAKIRPNQFNGLYVKSAHEQATSLCNKRPQLVRAASSSQVAAAAAAAAAARSSGGSSEDNSASSSASSADESDEWMESTMV